MMANYGARIGAALGRSVLGLNAERLIAIARRRTGLEDLGGEDFREPLALVLHSLDQEAHLSFPGRLAARFDILRMIETRAMIERDRAQNPGIAAVAVRRPLFIVGLPRTGTTLLHGLLAQDPANRAPESWEVMYPSPPPEAETRDQDPRIEKAERQIRWLDWLAPGFQAIHPVAARLAQECIVIQAHAFSSFQFQTMYNVPGYQVWLEASDLRAGYEHHRKFLQQLEWRSPGERWVLKAPAHLYGLEALFRTYPDACIVQTHREPMTVMASLASLTVALRRAFSIDVRPAAVAREQMDRWARGLALAMAYRERSATAEDRFLDVLYDDLVRDPLGTVRRIYAHFGFALREEAEMRMRDFLARNPKDRFGVHHYRLEDFGLDPRAESRLFDAYRERFGIPADAP